jgi:outer membrane protein assembly factor BamB
VLCYDPESGEKLWEFSASADIFDMDMLWTSKQVPSYSMKSSGSNLFLTAGYSAYCIDSTDGSIVWVFNGTNKILCNPQLKQGVFW